MINNIIHYMFDWIGYYWVGTWTLLGLAFYMFAIIFYSCTDKTKGLSPLLGFV